MPELMTAEEHAIVEHLGDLWNRLCKVVGDGPSRAGDLDEAVIHIHALQQFVMAQAAGRAYPDRYRLLGLTLAARQQMSAER